MSLIALHDLTKQYPRGVTALDGLSLELEPGIIGLVGANGAGKSTLIKIMLGLLDPSEGSVRVLGLDPAADGEAVRARVGYMPEHGSLPPDMIAAEFVTHMARIRSPNLHPSRSSARDGWTDDELHGDSV